MDRRDCIRLAAATVAARLLPISAAFAQSKYPQSTIRLVVRRAALWMPWRANGPIG